MKIIDIACICHQANRALCEKLGVWTVPNWIVTTTQHRESLIEGVKFCLSNPDAPPSANHESWYNHKAAEGWVYGEVKDEAKKTHPCMVLYEELPPQQQAKDMLFKNIVSALKPLLLGGLDSDWVESFSYAKTAVRVLEKLRREGQLKSGFQEKLDERIKSS